MADLKITFELRITPRLARWGLTALLVGLCAPELASESVTLTTYYPAPSGVYTNMITTQQTYLARDVGGGPGVRIGGTAAPGHTLDVSGDGNFSSNLATGGNLTVTGTGGFGGAVNIAQGQNVNVGGEAYLSSGGNYMHLSNNTYYNGGAWVSNGSAGALLQFASNSINFYRHNGGGAFTTEMQIDSSGNEIVNSGNLYLNNGSIDATSSSVFRGYGGGFCAGSFLSFGAGVTNCPGGTYATLTSGIMTKYQVINNSVDPNGEMLCCNCGAAGCPSF